MTEKRVLVKNIEINYKVFGPPAQAIKGYPMLILHGWGSSSERWQRVGELLAEKNLQVIIPDLPGFGKSQAPGQSWNLDNYIEWVREFTEHIPELTNEFYLLGHSFGGSLAVKFSIKYNQKVSGLFLVSAACVRKLKFSKKLWYRFSKIIKLFSFLPYYNLARKAFYKFILQKSDYPYVKGVMKETYIKVVSEDLSLRLSFIRVPTTIIWGDKDTLTPLSDAHFINKKIHHSKLIIIPNAKHALQIEVPEVLVEKILENLTVKSYTEELLSLKNII
jgi:pimeloyl-ACP methyl ester carboxylesterase